MTTMTAKLPLILALTLVASLATACSQDSGTAAARSAPDPTQPATHQQLFAHYESLRSLLANDRGKGVRASAQAAQSIAGKLGKSATGAAATRLSAVAAAAKKLAAIVESDLPALRLGFGDLSRALIDLVQADLAQADPTLAGTLHLFECPMAKGFKRWLQPQAVLENPYMGQAMLSCGSEITSKRP